MENSTVLFPIPLDRLRSLLTEIVKTELAHHQQRETKKAEPDEWITIAQAAKLLGVSLPTIHKWKKSGLLPYSRIGHTVRIKRSDVVTAGEQITKTASSRRYV